MSLDVSESQWRSGQALRPYVKDAQRILSWAHQQGHPRINQPKIDFLHLPIVDGSVTTDDAICRLRDDCCERILKGEKLYIHCWGGHGRTGTLVCLILGKLYGLKAPSALFLCQGYHDARRYPQNVRSPQTPVQRVQVQRILGSTEARQINTLPKSVSREMHVSPPSLRHGRYNGDSHVRSSSDVGRRAPFVHAARLLLQVLFPTVPALLCCAALPGSFSSASEVLLAARFFALLLPLLLLAAVPVLTCSNPPHLAASGGRCALRTRPLKACRG